VELGEVEQQLGSHPQVKAAVVVAREEGAGLKRLCGYYVSEGELSASSLKEYLRAHLPEYMVPSSLMALDALPLNVNGKVDKAALPSPENTSGKAYVAPRTKTEEILVQVWQDVLGVVRIGIEDPFFEMGGDSIKAIQVVSRLQRHHLKLGVGDLLRHATIANLSAHVVDLVISAEQGHISGPVPLTPIQKWFSDRDPAWAGHFNQAFMLYRKEGFEPGLVEKAFSKIIEHHDALRMAYRRDAVGLTQTNRDVGEGKAFGFEVISCLDPEDIKSECERLQAGMDLAHGPLVNLGLFKTPDGDHLLISIHHLVVDGVSWRILAEDFASAYQQGASGKSISFPPKSTSFQAWAVAVESYAGGRDVMREKAYWKSLAKRSKNADTASLGLRPGTLADSASLEWMLSASETEKLLRDSNAAYNTDIQDLLLAALGLGLGDLLGKESVLVDLEGHGRSHPLKDLDVARTVGWFTVLYPVLLDLSMSGDLSLHIRHIKETLRKVPNGGFGYGVLRYLSGPENEREFDLVKPVVGFNYLGQFDQDIPRELFDISPLSTGREIHPNAERMHALDLHGGIRNGRLTLGLSYNRASVQEIQARAFFTAFQRRLQEIKLHCQSVQSTVATPSDLGYKNLSLEALEKINALIQNQK